VHLASIVLTHPSVDPTAENSILTLIISGICIRDSPIHDLGDGIVLLLLEDGRADPAANNFEALRNSVKYWRVQPFWALLMDDRAFKVNASLVVDWILEGTYGFNVYGTAENIVSIKEAAKYGMESFLLAFFQTWSNC
jgi:hypothetical protein